MRGFYKKPPAAIPMYGMAYMCNHPMYNMCTLFKDDTDKGLAVVRLYFDEDTKHFWWGPIEDYLANDIYLAPTFKEYFDNHASLPNDDGVYPTEKLRQLMWALRMRPLHKEYYERW